MAAAEKAGMNALQNIIPVCRNKDWSLVVRNYENPMDDDEPDAPERGRVKLICASRRSQARSGADSFRQDGKTK